MIWLCVAYLAIGFVCFIVAGLFWVHEICDREEWVLLLVWLLWPVYLLMGICTIIEKLSERGYLFRFFRWMRYKLGMKED
jgi:hypothetical protein